ncbi:MAG: hypothetical protein K1X79_07935 [Oligoflexia bacterium]|nr:hypothetical protein [Oligoflexia bacterium]
MKLPPLNPITVLDPSARGPICVGDVPANHDPYQGLEIVTGCEHPDSQIRRIAESVRTQQGNAARSTIVVPEGHLVGADPGRMTELEQLALPRFGENSIFLLMDRPGAAVYQSAVRGLREGVIEGLATFSDAIHGGMDNYREMLVGLDDAHRAHLGAAIDLPEGGILLETGAGRDLSRLMELQRVALARGGRLICHDIPPAAARWAAGEERLSGVPYLALPSNIEFFSPALGVFGAPIVMTLQNTISSMSFGAVRHLAENARRIDATRIVVSQMVGMADQSNFYPDQLRPNDPMFLRCVQANIPAMLANAGVASSGLLGDLLIFCATQQALTTYRLLTAEIAHRWLRSIASEGNGFRYGMNYVVVTERELRGPEVQTYLAGFQPAAASFYGTLFNSLSIGPFGCRFAFDERLERGALTLKSMESVCVLDKSRPCRVPEARTPNTRIIAAKGEAQVFSASVRQQWLSARQAAVLAAIASGEAPNPQIFEYSQVTTAFQVGARFTLGFVFDYLGKQLGIPSFEHWSTGQARQQYERAFLRYS